jgi:ADP-heptose:LPS heptosyltransferase
MKVSTMRRVDAWIGIPLCLIASALRKLFRRSVAADPPKSVLIIKLSELGALVTLGPAMASLTRLVGKKNLYFLTFGESRGLLEILDYVPRENIFTLRTDSLAGLAGDALFGLLRLRRKRIDCSLDLDFFSRATALLGWLSGCRQRVGCHAYFGEGPYRGDLLTHRLKFNPHIHVSQMFEILADAVQKPAGHFPRVEFIPGPADAVRQQFQPSPAELAAIERMLGEVGAGPQDTLVLLNSNISDRESIPLRKWADERYVELAKLIVAGTPNSFVLLTGGAREIESIARLEADIGQSRCRSVAGKTTLRELLTLYTRSAMLITNDSGPAHFATLTKIEVVVLFGPETPMLWRPLGDRVRVIYRGLGCSPCFSVYNGRQSACQRNICMEIAPAEVYEVVRQRLAERRERVQGSLTL